MVISKKISTVFFIGLFCLQSGTALASCKTLQADEGKLAAWTTKYNNGATFLQKEVGIMEGLKTTWTTDLSLTNSDLAAMQAADAAYTKNKNAQTLAAKKAADAAYAKAKKASDLAYTNCITLYHKIQSWQQILGGWDKQVIYWTSVVAADKADCMPKPGGR